MRAEGLAGGTRKDWLAVADKPVRLRCALRIRPVPGPGLVAMADLAVERARTHPAGRGFAGRPVGRPELFLYLHGCGGSVLLSWVRDCLDFERKACTMVTDDLSCRN